jgi:hypothetical protein
MTVCFRVIIVNLCMLLLFAMVLIG